ncbi:unnamed protein product [Pleuronectes platessa]|uniref:Uncharacterized protein n=1 Tax=Pleuronectes platessa TaxID=8262 RepID=A0A9N7TZA6_PLEPL|nr:unnamed protein product [Pleuronectes platessa]
MSTVPKTLEQNNSRDLFRFLYVRNDTLEFVEWDYDRKIRNSLATWPWTIPHHHLTGSGERRPGSGSLAPRLALAHQLKRANALHQGNKSLQPDSVWVVEKREIKTSGPSYGFRFAAFSITGIWSHNKEQFLA